MLSAASMLSRTVVLPLFAALTVSLAPTTTAQPAASQPTTDIATACGTPLSDNEIDTIATLSDTGTLTGDAMHRLETAVDRHHRIVELLVAHRDRRGLFAIGLDGVEELAVMPLQRDPAAFHDPEYAHAISLELLSRFLNNLHAEFTGGIVERQWAHYFALTRRCELSPARVAMAGYDAHLVVDLAYSIAAVGTRPEDAPDYFKIVDAIATAGFVIVDRTKAAYGADLGPLFRFYFLGEGLDLLLGQGVATVPLLRLADLSANVVIFGNGLALQDPVLHGPTTVEIGALFDAADIAFEVLAQLRGL